MAENRDVFEKALDMMIDEAVSALNEKDDKELAEVKKVEFSPEHNEKMKKIFKKQRGKTVKHNFIVYGKRVACICFVTIVLSAISIGSVKAWRERVLNFFFDENATNSDYNFSELGGTHYSDDYISLSYVPWGFEVSNSAVTSREVIVYFEKEDLFFEVNIHGMEGGGAIDTEDVLKRSIDINGIEGVLLQKENLNQIIWTDEEDFIYMAGNISTDELIKIAKNLKKL